MLTDVTYGDYSLACKLVRKGMGVGEDPKRDTNYRLRLIRGTFLCRAGETVQVRLMGEGVNQMRKLRGKEVHLHQTLHLICSVERLQLEQQYVGQTKSKHVTGS